MTLKFRISSSFVHLAVSLPLFISLSPIAGFMEIPGEVLPYSLALAPLVMLLCRGKHFFANRWFFSSFALNAAPLLLFIFLLPGNSSLLVKNLSYLSPICYLICYAGALRLSLDAKSKYNFRSAIWSSTLVMLAFLAIGFLSPPLLDHIRALFVNDLGNRVSEDMLSYSGSPGLFSEPSYQALIGVSILSSCLASPLQGPNLKLAISCLVVILLTRSLSGIGIALLLLALRLVYSFICSLPALLKSSRVRKSNLFKLGLLSITVSVVVPYLLQTYSRFSRLLDLALRVDLSNVLNSLAEIEQSFGSNRLFAQTDKCSDSIIQQLISGLPNASEFQSCVSGFSTFQQLHFSIGLAPAIIFISISIILLYRFSTSVYALQGKSTSFGFRFLSVFFTVFNLLLLGPVASPFLYMPLLRPFDDE